MRKAKRFYTSLSKAKYKTSIVIYQSEKRKF